MKTGKSNARWLVETKVICNQPSVADTLLEDVHIDVWKLRIRTKQGPLEIFEWWLVTETFANLLADEGEIILSKYNCYWWGRTTTGGSNRMGTEFDILTISETSVAVNNTDEANCVIMSNCQGASPFLIFNFPAVSGYGEIRRV